MNTVIKGTKTIAEYKRVREDMENLARANYARHKEAFEEWGEGEPVKAWFDFEGNFCIEYESGKWWHYNDKSNGKYATMPESTDGHILIVGGAGSGKTAAVAIPTLMLMCGKVTHKNLIDNSPSLFLKLRENK